MPRLVIPGFAGPSNLLDPINVDLERTINFYPESTAPGSPKAPLVLRRTPGSAIFANIDSGPIRGIIFQDDRAGLVSGGTFYGFLEDGSTTAHGTVTVDAFPATMSINGSAGHQLFITSGGMGYIYDYLPNTFAQITDPDFITNARMGLFLDGYFVALKGESRAFQISALEDGTTWDALDIAERSEGSDDIVGIGTAHRELWLLGSQTSEVWTNIGDADFPFAPINGVFLEQGCCAPFSIQRYDNSLMWVGLDARGVGVVYKANGYTPQRVSTTAVERALQQANFRSTLRYAQAWTYQFQGHLFYVLFVPDNETTWQYDASTGLWSEFAHWDSVNEVYVPHRGVCHAFAYGKTIIGDRLTGALYELLQDQYTDDLVDV